MKYISAVLSQVSVWGIKNSSLQWTEVLWHSSGGGCSHVTGCWHALLLALLLISFLLSGCSFCVGRETRRQAAEIKLTAQAIWKAFRWAQGQSGGFISGKAAVVKDGRVIKPLRLPQSSLLARGPALTLWDEQRGRGAAPSPQDVPAVLPAPLGTAWHRQHRLAPSHQA